MWWRPQADSKVGTIIVGTEVRHRMDRRVPSTSGPLDGVLGAGLRLWSLRGLSIVSCDGVIVCLSGIIL